MKIRPLRLLVGGIIFGAIFFYIVSLRLGSLETSSEFFSFSSWLQGKVLGISYKDKYCKHLINESSKYPPVYEVAKQLNIQDKESIFVNGLHCGEWLVALKKAFPDIKLYGVDKDPDSVYYVSKLVEGNFKTALPFELQSFSFGSLKFDHAIIDGVLSIYPPDYQCKAIKQMIPMLKAGGSLYIGRNFETCDHNRNIENALQKYLHVKLLPKCYWSDECLHGRNDIVEILYSHENNMFPSLDEERNSNVNKIKEKLLFDFSMCATAVFIYRHIVLLSPHKDLKEKILPQSKHDSEKHKHKCTKSESLNSTRNKIFDKEGIRNAIKDIKMRGLDPLKR